MASPADPEPPTPRAFDRMMNEKVLDWGSRRDVACPRCGERGYRMIADSELVSLFACRRCGYQSQELHEPRAVAERPFREYREGRGLIAAYEDEREEASE